MGSTPGSVLNFIKYFGEGSMTLSIEEATVTADIVNYGWLATKVLNMEAFKVYNAMTLKSVEKFEASIREWTHEYNMLSKPAWDEYEKTIETAQARLKLCVGPSQQQGLEYEKVVEAAKIAFQEKRGTHSYGDVVDAAFRVYQLEVAINFVNAYWGRKNLN